MLKNNFLIEFPGGLEPKIWSGSAANLSIDRTLHFQGVIKVVFSGHLPLVEWYFWFTTVHFIKDDRDILISYIKQLFFFLDRSFRTWSFGISMKLVHCNLLVNYNVQCTIYNVGALVNTTVFNMICLKNSSVDNQFKVYRVTLWIEYVTLK